MGTLSALKARMVAELGNRTDLTTPITNAVSDAVAEYQGRRFWFNQASTTFSTVAGTDSYTTATIPDDIAQVDSLRLTSGGSIYALREVAWSWIDDAAINTASRGRPSRWAYYAQSIRLYPTPDAAYTITIKYHQKVDAPSAEGDSNVWTTEAEELIRLSAMRRVYGRHLMNGQQAAQYAAEEARALQRLTRDTHQLETGPLVGCM